LFPDQGVIVLYSLAAPAVVGIDMNAEEIRLLRLRGRRIEDFAIAGLPPGAITGNQIRQAKTVQSVLKNLVDATGSAGCCAVLAIPASEAILQRGGSVSKPDLQHITGDEYCFDYCLLPSGETEWIAASREHVNQLVAITAYAGLKIKVVEIDSHALERASANPFAKMNLAKHLHKETFSQHAAQLELCRGLALRKISRW
jgi:Tfp pilus assembly PilM family ATPase